MTFFNAYNFNNNIYYTKSYNFYDDGIDTFFRLYVTIDNKGMEVDKMNNSKKAKIRQSKIRDMLLKQDVVTLQEFCESLQASTATIRNDLTFLEKEGVLKRVIGGAISCEGTPRNTGYHTRINLYKEEKESIAKYVVKKYVKKGMRIALDAGSTNHYIALEIVRQEIPCTIITYSFNISSLCANINFIDLYCVGGKLDREHNAFHDEIANVSMKKLESDVYFLSPNGIDVKAKISSSALEESDMKRIMIENAKDIYIVADHSKFNKRAEYPLLEFSKVTAIISDVKLEKKEVDKYKLICNIAQSK